MSSRLLALFDRAMRTKLWSESPFHVAQAMPEDMPGTETKQCRLFQVFRPTLAGFGDIQFLDMTLHAAVGDTEPPDRDR